MVSRPARSWDLGRITIAALICVHVWRLQDLIPGSEALKAQLVVTGGAVGLAIFDPATLRRASLRWRHPATRLALGLLVLGALSVPGSLYPGLSLEFLLQIQLVATLVFLLVTVGIRGPEDVERFAAVQLIGATVYAGTILLRYDVGPDGRLGDLVYYDANDLGMLLVCMVPFALHFAWGGKRLITRGLALMALALFLSGIVRTGSRGAFLGLIAVGLYALFRGREIPLRWRLGGIATAALVIVLVGSDRYWTMMNTLLHPKSDYNWVGKSPGGRMEVWRRGVGYMFAHPLLGVGLGAFPVAEGTISPLAERQSYGGGAKWSAAHNSFVQIGGELGVTGLAMFLALLWTAYRRLVKRRPPRPVMAHPIGAALLGYVVTGAFLSQAYAPLLFSLIGIAVGAAQTFPPAAPPDEPVEGRPREALLAVGA